MFGQVTYRSDATLTQVSCVRFRPGVASSDLVSAGDDGLLCVLDTQRHPGEDEALRIAMNSEESVERLAFAADGQMCLGCCGCGAQNEMT